MLTGPNGERRPTSPTAAAVSVVREITEKYADAATGDEPAAIPGRETWDPSADAAEVRGARPVRVPG